MESVQHIVSMCYSQHYGIVNATLSESGMTIETQPIDSCSNYLCSSTIILLTYACIHIYSFAN